MPRLLLKSTRAIAQAQQSLSATELAAVIPVVTCDERESFKSVLLGVEVSEVLSMAASQAAAATQGCQDSARHRATTHDMLVQEAAATAGPEVAALFLASDSYKRMLDSADEEPRQPRGLHCDGCGASGEARKLLKCDACGWVWFCSPACQKKGAPASFCSNTRTRDQRCSGAGVRCRLHLFAPPAVLCYALTAGDEQACIVGACLEPQLASANDC